jgi:hypothetical protein
LIHSQLSSASGLLNLTKRLFLITTPLAMILAKSLFALAGLSTVSALALPAETSAPASTDGPNVADAVVTLTLPARITEGGDVMTTMAPTPVTCFQKWCENGSSYCVYWAGITGWDVSRGVIPGMTVVPFADCSVTPSWEVPGEMTSGTVTALPIPTDGSE